MEASPKRINVTLDAEQAEKLARMAERAHLQEGTLAKSLLSVAIDSANLDARHVHLILESIPGALDRAQAGLAQARDGKLVPIDEI
ncbi:MAG: hypothetical protein ACSLFF_04450 [Solirubrobacterales bacterium]